MAKVKIDTGNGVCVVETSVELDEYHESRSSDGLRWIMIGYAIGSGIRCRLESCYPTRSIARKEAKGFIQAITDTLTEDNDDE